MDKLDRGDASDARRATGGLAIVMALVGGIATAIACQPKPDPNLEDECPPCSSGPGDTNWNCVLDIQNQVQDQYKIVCASDNDNDIDAECNSACADWSAAHPTSPCVGWDNPHETYECLDTPASTEGDPPWSPGSYVYFSGGVYHVDSALVDQLKTDASLLDNDSAWLKSTSTYWQFQAVRSTDLAYKLGFRTNDYVEKVNGTYVRTLHTVVDLLHNNYYSTSFSVQIKRGTSTITMYYVID